MDMEKIRLIQGCAFIVFIMFLSFVLYGYYFYLKKSEKNGDRNYEQYGRLALNDGLNDEILEPYSKTDAKEEFKK